MKHLLRTGAGVMLFAGWCLSSGCGNDSGLAAGVNGSQPPEVEVELVTRVLDGTIGQLAYLEGGGPTVIRGYGLVVGLAGTGSSQVPTEVRRRLVRQMTQMGIGGAKTGTGGLTPNRLIDDLDTAPVVVSALIPPGTPAGTVLDASVAPLPNSQTLSLDGGMLYMTELRAFSTVGGEVRESRVLGKAAGAVFVNPFTDERDPTATARLRRGRIIGGCTTTRDQPIRLVLRQPDHGMARILQETINGRFSDYPPVATAKDPSFLMIRIPNRYRRDYERFLDVLTHVYIRRGGGIEDLKARQLVEAIADPAAPRESISLIWEAMGRQVLPIIRQLYLHDELEVAYYAARAGGRGGDPQAVEVLSVVAKSDSPLRLEAIAELGRIGTVAAAETLRELLNDPDATVRVATYEAISDARLGCGVKRYDVNGAFRLDVVPSTESYLVYAARSGEPRIALFGDGLQLRRPVFFSSPDDLVTINASAPDAEVEVYRRVGSQKRLSETVSVLPDLASLVRVLGGPPERDADGGFKGLGLTYSQVVGVLYRLCEDRETKRIPAVFVLQRPDATDTIVAGRLPPGRQDTERRQ